MISIILVCVFSFFFNCSRLHDYELHLSPCLTAHAHSLTGSVCKMAVDS